MTSLNVKFGSDCSCGFTSNHLSYLFIQELPGILLYVSFIQVGGQAHQTHLGQAEVCELDVAH